MTVPQLLGTAAPRPARQRGWLQEQGGRGCGGLLVGDVGREAEALSCQDQLAETTQILL